MVQFDSSVPPAPPRRIVPPAYAPVQREISAQAASLQASGAMPPPPLNYATPAVLAYASPQIHATHNHYGREGNLLITGRTCELPDLCVKCGSREATRRIRKTYYWHQPAWALLVLVNLLLYAIVALCLRKSATVTVSLCRVHHRQRIVYTIYASLLLITGVPAALVTLIWSLSDNRAPQPWLWIGLAISLSFVVLGAVWATTKARLLAPKEINRDYAWFRGASEVFLSSICR